MEQVLNFWIRVINNFLYFQQAMLLPTTIQEGGGLGNKSILCLNKFLSLKLSKNQNEFLAPSEAKGARLSVGPKVLFLHLSASESKIFFWAWSILFRLFVSIYFCTIICVHLCDESTGCDECHECHEPVSRCVRDRGLSSTGCNRSVTLGVTTQTSESGAGRENSPRLRHGASEHITHGKMRDGESESWPRLFPRYSCSTMQSKYVWLSTDINDYKMFYVVLGWIVHYIIRTVLKDPYSVDIKLWVNKK